MYENIFLQTGDWSAAWWTSGLLAGPTRLVQQLHEVSPPGRFVSINIDLANRAFAQGRFRLPTSHRRFLLTYEPEEEIAIPQLQRRVRSAGSLHRRPVPRSS